MVIILQASIDTRSYASIGLLILAVPCVVKIRLNARSLHPESSVFTFIPYLPSHLCTNASYSLSTFQPLQSPPTTPRTIESSTHQPTNLLSQ